MSVHLILLKLFFFWSQCTSESKGCKNHQVTAINKLFSEIEIVIVPCCQVKVGLVDLYKFKINLLLIN